MAAQLSANINIIRERSPLARLPTFERISPDSNKCDVHERLEDLQVFRRRIRTFNVELSEEEKAERIHGFTEEKRQLEPNELYFVIVNKEGGAICTRYSKQGSRAKCTCEDCNEPPRIRRARIAKIKKQKAQQEEEERREADFATLYGINTPEEQRRVTLRSYSPENPSQEANNSYRTSREKSCIDLSSDDEELGLPEPVSSLIEATEVTEADLVEPEPTKEKEFRYVLLKNSEENGVIESQEPVELGSWFQNVAKIAEKYEFFHNSISPQQRRAREQLLSCEAVTEEDLPVRVGNFEDYLRREGHVQGIQDNPEKLSDGSSVAKAAKREAREIARAAARAVCRVKPGVRENPVIAESVDSFSELDLDTEWIQLE